MTTQGTLWWRSCCAGWQVLKVAIVDANEHANRLYAGQASSVVGQWLAWEMDRAGVQQSAADAADIILLAFAGALDWSQECRRALRRAGVLADAARRNGRPYVIAGGPVDAIPITALAQADAVAIGEGYYLVRELLSRVIADDSAADIDDWLRAYQHAITRSQLAEVAMDPERPWLMLNPPGEIATPDARIDWSVPPVKSDDKVVRVIGSKGCHFKCGFCATTYRQQYAMNPHESRVLRTVGRLVAAGERVQILSNDPLNIPWFRNVSARLDSESFTVAEVADRANRAAIIRSRPRMARFGVEGLSERVRRAFGKPIASDALVELLADFHGHGINTHLFFIVGAPYESATDWAEFRDLYRRLGLTLRKGLCRIKLTTFIPTPPAPLTRYVPGAAYERRMADLRHWIGANAASRHIVYVRGRGNDTRVASVAEQLGVGHDVAQRLCASDETIDLAPRVEDFSRLQHGLVSWPIESRRRWQVSETYRRRMAAAQEVA